MQFRSLFRPAAAPCLAALLTLAACSGKEKATTAERTGSSPVVTDAASARRDTTSSRKNSSEKEVIIGQTTWEYQKRTETERGITHKATLTSPTRLQFGFPYEGGATPTLSIRKRDSEKATVYLQVSRGQFNKSFQGGSVRISFDGGPPETYIYSAAANGSSTVVFFDAADKLIRHLKTARNTVIDVVFFNQGNRKIEFRTAGLRWNH